MIESNLYPVLVLGPDSVRVDLRKTQDGEESSVYELDTKGGLDRLRLGCGRIQAKIGELSENSQERAKLEKKLACTIICLESVRSSWWKNERIWKSWDDIKDPLKNLTQNLFFQRFFKFSNASLGCPDGQTHTDILERELAKAMTENEKERARDCIAQLKDLVNNSHDEIRQFSSYEKDRILRALDRWSLAISTEDYATYPLWEFYSVLKDSFPHAFDRFFTSLIFSLPGRLESIQDLTNKLKTLLGIIPLHDDSEKRSLEYRMAEMVNTEGLKLIEQVASEDEKQPSHKLEWLSLLEGCFPHLTSTKEYLDLKEKGNLQGVLNMLRDRLLRAAASFQKQAT